MQLNRPDQAYSVSLGSTFYEYNLAKYVYFNFDKMPIYALPGADSETFDKFILKGSQYYVHVNLLLESNYIKLPIQVYLPPNNKVNDAIVNKFPNAKKYALLDPWNNPLAFVYKIYD